MCAKKQSQTYQEIIGQVIEQKRLEKGWTQTKLAAKIGTSQSAVHRIEKGRQNVSLDLLQKFSKVFDSQILSVNSSSSQSYRIYGGRELSGSVAVNTSKNAAVGLLCASLLNSGKTTLRHLARIEEVFRIIEVLESIGVKCRWINHNQDLEIIPPYEYKLNNLNIAAARRTRSVIMLMGPLLHRFKHFHLPYAGGCTLGTRTINPHLKALSHFGLEVDAKTISGTYDITVDPAMLGRNDIKATHADKPTITPMKPPQYSANLPDKRIVLIERGDTVTENALMAAALYPGKTTIINASSNYMVQDVCFFLEKLGVKIDGIGGTTLTIYGVPTINTEIEYAPSEDPIEAMSFIAVALVTNSEITIKRAPIDFLEVELEILRSMNAKIEISSEYLSANNRSRLVDITIKKSKLIAPTDKIAPMPYPGLNIDNLPFFSVIAACAKGRTLIHDWVFENRAVYTTYLENLNASVELLDAHRIYIEGPTNWHTTEQVAPPALRPAVVVMIAMLAAPGTSILRNIYSINRGYQDFAARLNQLGAKIEPLTGI